LSGPSLRKRISVDNPKDIQDEELDARTQAAVDELRALVLQDYRVATFDVQRGIDDPEAIHLWVTVDLEDTDEVVNLVIEPTMQIQIEREIPVFVIPIRIPDRIRAMREAAQAKRLADVMFQRARLGPSPNHLRAGGARRLDTAPRHAA
jgi:hypothetical protein